MDEEDPRPRASARGVTRDLRTLSVEELQGYVAELKAEIARVEAEIVKRRDVRGAAEAMFRKPAAGRD